MLDLAFPCRKSWAQAPLVAGQDQHPKGDSCLAKLLAPSANVLLTPNEAAESRRWAAAERRSCVDKAGTAGQNENASMHAWPRLGRGQHLRCRLDLVGVSPH